MVETENKGLLDNLEEDQVICDNCQEVVSMDNYYSETGVCNTCVEAFESLAQLYCIFA